MLLPKTKLLAKYARVLNQEILSVWLVILALTINFAAWVIPRGSYQAPTHDPLKIAGLVAQMMPDAAALYYFWHAIIALTAFIVLYGTFRVWTLSMTSIVDRVDL